ncbi:hypothetical protein BC351_01155 [Paenibacillus ferrarius]|uniref:Single-stranded-DNA-specific exonuclease RecJ n=1 Tax=Paenibacillus ferrarius TaxID=1469647 RepID=A0A1V4HSF5_9BACL|nr:DHH family phosphoesterase [Paenibacillus ferrarius]OPH61879.1 hypothetical protein BC351_01155 [Paenibacillus ferrarius]
MKNVNTATERIYEAVARQQNISIMADPDSDGLNSTAILYNYLSKITDNITYFYGSRTRGHGLHTVIDEIPKQTNLLIVLDSSSSEAKECKHVQDTGIDVIVIDHHLIENPNDNCILVNPQQEGCSYPNKNLSCSALIWQICRVLDDKFNVNYSQDLVDMAAIGLISDMMCMKTMENRAIVSLGLSNVKNIGLAAILGFKGLKNKEKLSTVDIGFNVSNLLNAVARMDKLGLGLELLTTKTYTRADELVKEIEKSNKERKKSQIKHTDFVQHKIDDTQKIIIILDHEKKIGKNFAGLIANDITKEYQRPCLILSPDAKEGKTYAGSYRSYNGFDLKSFFESTGLVMYAAGHLGAGGVGVFKDKIEPFINKVQELAKDLDFEDTIEYDLEFDCDEINESIIIEISKFYRITGANFPLGKFLVKNLFVNDVEVMGKNKDTIKVSCGNVTLMKFRTKETYKDKVPIFSGINAVGTLNTNSYYNFQQKKMIKTNQVFIEDILIG